VGIWFCCPQIGKELLLLLLSSVLISLTLSLLVSKITIGNWGALKIVLNSLLLSMRFGDGLRTIKSLINACMRWWLVFALKSQLYYCYRVRWTTIETLCSREWRSWIGFVDIELKYEFRNVFSINWTNNFTILIDISAFKFDKHLFWSEILDVVSAYQFLPLSDVFVCVLSETFLDA
jgi:hypothetical protein